MLIKEGTKGSSTLRRKTSSFLFAYGSAWLLVRFGLLCVTVKPSGDEADVLNGEKTTHLMTRPNERVIM